MTVGGVEVEHVEGVLPRQKSATTKAATVSPPCGKIRAVGERSDTDRCAAKMVRAASSKERRSREPLHETTVLRTEAGMRFDAQLASGPESMLRVFGKNADRQVEDSNNGPTGDGRSQRGRGSPGRSGRRARTVRFDGLSESPFQRMEIEGDPQGVADKNQDALADIGEIIPTAKRLRAGDGVDVVGKMFRQEGLLSDSLCLIARQHGFTRTTRYPSA